MPFNTITVASAVTPQVIETYFSHYLNRRPLHQKPTAHISYHEGLHLIRQFLYYASHHTVEEIQAFTSQWVPHPRWVRVEDVTIPQKFITDSADAITAQLGREGVKQVGGVLWWQWRRPRTELKAEWIEMRGDYNARKKKNQKGNRVILYVHGGAYFFGSVDEHRYQMQRHARKLKAKVFAPRYRLAPQFPFPCGLHDCLSAYLYLLTLHSPTEIILAGDSAGGGMVVSMLVTLRDQSLPLPAGSILLSPWVDLTHSFPSLAGDSSLDYIPAHGFMQRPSLSWPPPNSDELEHINEAARKQGARDRGGNYNHKKEIDGADIPAIQGFAIHHREEVRGSRADTATESTVTDPKAELILSPSHELSITIDGSLIEIKDQIQMYAPNHLLSHPLVSPILQPSLGGLPPLLIQTGGGEMLRDEQIYLGHKAAHPAKYPPPTTILDLHDPSRDMLHGHKPTHVQLQVWDDLCHVAPTLSFTRPAKFMYRSIAQFGAWALARAQMTEIEILDDDNVSIISSGSDTDSDSSSALDISSTPASHVGKAGDPLPTFHNHMIRQRVDRHGIIYPLPSALSLPGCQMEASTIGTIKEGPVRKWLAARKQWDAKYASERRRINILRAKYMSSGGYETFAGDEIPPPSALAGRRRKGLEEKLAEKRGRNWGMMLWSLWGSKHDKNTLTREERADKKPEVPIITTTTMADSTGRTRSVTAPTTLPALEVVASGTRTRGFSLTGKPRHSGSQSRSRSRRRTVTDTGQADERPSFADENGEEGSSQPSVNSSSAALQSTLLSPGYIPSIRKHRPDLSPDADYPRSPFLNHPSSADRNPSTTAILDAPGVCEPVSRTNSLDSSSNFDVYRPMRPRFTTNGDKSRNASAVAVVQHEGVCEHIQDEQGKDDTAWKGDLEHDVRYDPLGRGRENASTMCVAEAHGIRGMTDENDGDADGVSFVRSEIASTVGTGTPTMEKEEELTTPAEDVNQGKKRLRAADGFEGKTDVKPEDTTLAENKQVSDSTPASPEMSDRLETASEAI